MIRAIWNYRSFIIGLVSKDFRTKYLNSVLGSLWSIINPLAMIIVYTVIFSEVMGAKIPGVDDTFSYSIYLCAGLLSWQYFLETTSRMVTIFIEQGNLLKKVSFPRITLPISVFLTSTVNFIIIFSLFLIFLICSNSFPLGTFLACIPLLILLQLFAIGFGIILAVLNVFFRDVGQFIGVLLQFLFWLTPIVYIIEIVPEWAEEIMKFNLLYPIIKGLQDIFLNNQFPDWATILPTLVVTIILLFIGFKMFKKLESEMVDEL